MNKSADDENLPFTGERFTCEPTLLHSQIYYEHVHRYLLAAERARGLAVLDIACGEGYGSHLLAQHAASVVGVDVSPEAVAHATRRYGGKKVRFLKGECQRIPLEPDTVDVVVSFETIEHIEEHAAFLSEVRRVLKPGGCLIISSPDRDAYAERGGGANPFHKKELSFAEFHRLLSREFRHVVVLQQRLVGGSYIAAAGPAPAEPMEYGVFHGDLTGGEFLTSLPHGLYSIAVCSDAAIRGLRVGLFENEVISAQIWNAHEMLPELRSKYEGALARVSELQGKLATSAEEFLRNKCVQLEKKAGELDAELVQRGNWGTTLNEEVGRLRELAQKRETELNGLRITQREWSAALSADQEAAANRERNLALEHEAERRAWRDRTQTVELDLAKHREELAGSELAARSRERNLTLEHEAARRAWRDRTQALELELTKHREREEDGAVALRVLREEAERKQATISDLTARLAASDASEARALGRRQEEQARLERDFGAQLSNARQEHTLLEKQLGEAQLQLAEALKEARATAQAVSWLDNESRRLHGMVAGLQKDSSELLSMKGSWSWRVTAPLRRVHQALGDPLYRFFR